MENETSDVQPKCQGLLQLLSPPFLMTSTTKQMRPKGWGGTGKEDTVVRLILSSSRCHIYHSPIESHCKLILVSSATRFPVSHNHVLSYTMHLMIAIYTDTCSCVCADGVLSDWFAVGSGRIALTCS